LGNTLKRFVAPIIAQCWDIYQWCVEKRGNAKKRKEARGGGRRTLWMEEINHA